MLAPTKQLILSIVAVLATLALIVVIVIGLRSKKDKKNKNEAPVDDNMRAEGGQKKDIIQIDTKGQSNVKQDSKLPLDDEKGNNGKGNNGKDNDGKGSDGKGNDGKANNRKGNDGKANDGKIKPLTTNNNNTGGIINANVTEIKKPIKTKTCNVCKCEIILSDQKQEANIESKSIPDDKSKKSYINPSYCDSLELSQKILISDYITFLTQRYGVNYNIDELGNVSLSFTDDILRLNTDIKRFISGNYICNDKHENSTQITHLMFILQSYELLFKSITSTLRSFINNNKSNLSQERLFKENECIAINSLVLMVNKTLPNFYRRSFGASKLSLPIKNKHLYIIKLTPIFESYDNFIPLADLLPMINNIKVMNEENKTNTLTKSYANHIELYLSLFESTTDAKTSQKNRDSLKQALYYIESFENYKPIYFIGLSTFVLLNDHYSQSEINNIKNTVQLTKKNDEDADDEGLSLKKDDVTKQNECLVTCENDESINKKSPTEQCLNNENLDGIQVDENEALQKSIEIINSDDEVFSDTEKLAKEKILANLPTFQFLSNIYAVLKQYDQALKYFEEKIKKESISENKDNKETNNLNSGESKSLLYINNQVNLLSELNAILTEFRENNVAVEDFNKSKANPQSQNLDANHNQTMAEALKDNLETLTTENFLQQSIGDDNLNIICQNCRKLNNKISNDPQFLLSEELNQKSDLIKWVHSLYDEQNYIKEDLKDLTEKLDNFITETNAISTNYDENSEETVDDSEITEYLDINTIKTPIEKHVDCDKEIKHATNNVIQPDDTILDIAPIDLMNNRIINGISKNSKDVIVSESEGLIDSAAIKQTKQDSQKADVSSTNDTKPENLSHPIIVEETDSNSAESIADTNENNFIDQPLLQAIASQLQTLTGELLKDPFGIMTNSKTDKTDVAQLSDSSSISDEYENEDLVMELNAESCIPEIDENPVIKPILEENRETMPADVISNSLDSLNKNINSLLEQTSTDNKTELTDHKTESTDHKTETLAKIEEETTTKNSELDKKRFKAPII
ncbi:hypothetical protein COBT_000176 [Conglomerata obtusa]